MKCTKGMCPGTIAAAAFGVFAIGYSGFTAVTGDSPFGSCSTEGAADQSLVAPVSDAGEAAPITSECSKSTAVLASTESDSAEYCTSKLASSSECELKGEFDGKTEGGSVELVSDEGASDKQCPYAEVCDEKDAQLVDADAEPAESETVATSDNG